MAVARTLHHFPLDPTSRQVRLALGEKRLAWVEVAHRYWERPAELQALNPSGLVPVLVEGEVTACEGRAVLEHLEEVHPSPALLPADAAGRAEARRLQQWFDGAFNSEVNALILHEKMEKRLLGLGAPALPTLRAGREALREHLRMLEGLLEVRDHLAGARLTFADLAAAAHLSVIDYVGEMPWDAAPTVRTWYARLKSRPSFRPLLADRHPGLPPAAHYADLDF